MEQEVPFLLKLPSEVIVIIARVLNLQDLINFSRFCAFVQNLLFSTSRFLQSICENSVWKEVYLQKFPNTKDLPNGVHESSLWKTVLNESIIHN